MQKCELYRFEHLTGQTLGVLKINGKFLCFTLENPWLDNQRNISCIPTGKYTVTTYVSKRYGLCFQVLNVPGRSGILFHSGNTSEHTKGCILPGIDVGHLKGKRAVLSSKIAMGELCDALWDDGEFELEIKDL